MTKITVSVAEVKKKFSEYVNRSAFAESRIVITKRNHPVAALVSIRDLQQLERNDQRKGLLATIRRWENFDDLTNDIDEAVKSRQEEGAGRAVSF